MHIDYQHVKGVNGMHWPKVQIKISRCVVKSRITWVRVNSLCLRFISEKIESEHSSSLEIIFLREKKAKYSLCLVSCTILWEGLLGSLKSII